jgi:prevent-host-death family protein
MPQTTVSSREFNQNLAGAKRAANDGPVVVTDRGKPSFVLMTHADYRRLIGQDRSLVELLRQDGPEADFAFEPQRLDSLVRPVTFD